MTNQRLPYLLNQYLDKRCSEQELAEFYALVNDPVNEVEFTALLDHAINTSTDEKQLDAMQQSNLLQYVFDYESPERGQEISSSVWGHLKWSIAAAIFIGLCSGLYYFKLKPQIEQNVDHVAVIKPGGNKAVLTLADGKVIDLQKAGAGELADLSGIKIVKTKAGQLVYRISNTENRNTGFNTVGTPRGGQYEVDLPDGTKVWLNAASSLKFPTTFSGLKDRKVELNGEAYFEVAKLKIPFIVVTAQQQLEVLGTHFNVNAYAEEQLTKTTLLEGSVKITALTAKKEVVLVPGQEALLDINRLTVRHADLERNMDWKNGIFIFKNENLEGIMRKIARWYDVEVSYDSAAPRKETFSGTVSRFDDVNKVLRRLELTGEVNFKIQGRKIIVSK